MVDAVSGVEKVADEVVLRRGRRLTFKCFGKEMRLAFTLCEQP